MPGECRIAELPRTQARAAERVSKTARRLFYRHGIRAVGVEEIVAEAGVTKPSLYRNFSSKDALIANCLQERFDYIMRWWDEMEADFPDDPLAQIHTLIAAVADDVGSPLHRGCAITNAAVEFPNESHPAHATALQYKQIIRGRLLALVSRLPVAQPALLADGLALLFEGAKAARHTSDACGPAASLQAVAGALLSAFLPPAD